MRKAAEHRFFPQRDRTALLSHSAGGREICRSRIAAEQETQGVPCSGGRPMQHEKGDDHAGPTLSPVLTGGRAGRARVAAAKCVRSA